MGDVTLQQPSLFVMAGRRPMIGAKTTQVTAVRIIPAISEGAVFTHIE